ncbi:uncharacterized protein LOC113315863 [Papaver somniferum]|uniref:uncharacterized protein LOC113315863 n=1 Tax=Papaver somniferum TaxID=3469 RepID=UPI000E6FDB5C|nr:uncharacterized protein LOC113315863 [Papaver somniferum]
MSKTLADNKGESSTLNDSSFPWKKFWAVKRLAPKIHMFLWRILHDGVGVFSKISKYIEGAPNDCQLCFSEVETVDHLFLRCNLSQLILFASPLSLRIINDGQTSLRSLVSSWLEISDNGQYFCLGASLLWAIWHARNKLVSEKEKININSVINHGLFWFNLYYNDNEDPELSTATGTGHIPVTHRCNPWIPPTTDAVKINIDAAIGKNNSSCAVVARDSQGRFLSAGTSLSAIRNPLVSEAGGFLLAFSLASRMNYNNIEIESDSQSIVRILNGESTRIPWRISRFIEEIKSSASTLGQVTYQSAPREANDAAHKLAKFAVANHVQNWWTSSQPPSCISSILALEAAHFLSS